MVIKRNTFQVEENDRKLKITNVDKDTMKMDKTKYKWTLRLET